MPADPPSAKQIRETFVKRKRRWPRWLFLLALLGVAGALAVRWITDPLTQAALLQRLVRDQLNAELVLQQPIELGFDPRPSLSAAGASLTLAGDEGPAIASGPVQISLHWDTLWGKDLRVHQVEARGLVADVDRILRLMPPSDNTGEAAAWPQIDAGISLSESVLAMPSAGITLIGMDFTMSSLRQDSPFTAMMAFRSAGGSLPAGAYALELAFTPEIEQGSLTLGGFSSRLELDAGELKDRIDASGRIVLGDALQFALDLASRDGLVPTLGATYRGGWLGNGELVLAPAPPLEPLAGTYQIEALDGWLAGWTGTLPASLPAHARIELPDTRFQDWSFKGGVIEIGPQDPPPAP
jgi:hypothetical protein